MNKISWFCLLFCLLYTFNALATGGGGGGGTGSSASVPFLTPSLNLLAVLVIYFIYKKRK
ncbi:hypothetical protein KO495_04130 [Colwellia sp. D2M02]|uniref:GlyGly-CTERM sorting domain-containing protein n=1 Tax=Colwellia asteriadis TaxID=517723 RepID=A0ABP3WKD6_9GAMM|nr:hypothetical protein [Colwellia sp. D2M02]MBU2892510.1 hypothetical protein [Colwellia sp. D2M02]